MILSNIFFQAKNLIGFVSISINLFFLLYLLLQPNLTQTLSNIFSLATPIIALIAYKEYRQKVVNKVNDKQLNKIIELVNFLRKKRKFYLDIIDNNSSLPISYHTDLLGFLDEKPSFIQKGEISKKDFVKIEKQLYLYTKDPLIPKEIAKAITILLSKIRHQNPRNYIQRWRASPTYNYIIQEHSQEENNKFEVINQKVFYNTLCDLVSEINDWLHEYNVKDINLPDFTKVEI